MPNIAFAPAAAAATVNAAAASSAGNAAPNGSAGASGNDAAASPFAAALQGQIAAQAASANEYAGLPVVDTTVDAPANDPIAAAQALLPMLLGLAAAQNNQAAGAAQTRTPGEGDASSPADPSAWMPIAAPLQAADLAAAARIDHAGSSDRQAANAFAGMPAILADAARRGEAQTGGNHTEEATFGNVADALPHPASQRADALAQAQMTHAAEPQRIEAPVGTRQWDGEFANRVAWLVGKQESRAELVLTPPQMGRVEISLSVQGDQATAIFTSASATTRDAIENALPRLREVLQEAGISLGQTHVGSESSQQSPGSPARDENGDNRGSALAAGRSGPGEPEGQDGRNLPAGFGANAPGSWGDGRGMIDLFA